MGSSAVIQSLRAFVTKQPRAFWLLVALCVVWTIAPQIQDFFSGFFDGIASSR